MLASADNVIDFNLSLEDWDGQKKAYPEEPMLIENSKRFVLFPIKHHDIWTLYKTAEAKFWSAEEIEFSDDVAHFSDLSGKEQSTMMQILIILATNDALIGPSVVAKISHDIQSPEARCIF